MLEEQKKRDEEKKQRKKLDSLDKKNKESGGTGGSGNLAGGNGVHEGERESAGAGLLSGGGGGVTSPLLAAKLKKNFASLDCGSKVINANPAARGSGNIIAPSK